MDNKDNRHTTEVTAEHDREQRQEHQAARMPRYRVPFGVGLRRRRQAQNLTAKDVGKMVGLTVSSVTRMEQRAAPPQSLDNVKKIARVLNAPLDDLLTGTIPAELVAYSDPIASSSPSRRTDSPRPYLPTPAQVALPLDAEFDAQDVAGELLGRLLADGIALEALAPDDLRALVRVSGAMRRAAEASAGLQPTGGSIGGSGGGGKERKRVRKPQSAAQVR